ncbi:acyl-CoA dehydrogenase [Nesidiocoris tenuis]|uniref:Acyl-CoA dehydrogenase n=1 Tax=Nesidiocoris tenuis TaxID=355587 RepID=A0ABN7BF61_9HEMI|nr:acyl-CoA dehydrogenase [Nesidiocoris tenuis]
MLVSRCCQLRNAALRHLRKRLHRRYSSAGSEAAPFADKQKSELGPAVKIAKSPFLKNVLLGRFDQEFLVYPEVVDLDELRQYAVEHLAVKHSAVEHPAIDNSAVEHPAVVPQSVAARVESLYRSNVPLCPVESCNESERMKICEMLDLDLPTALVLDTQSLVVRIVSAFGDEHLKSKYLGKLKSGELKAAFAMSESATGSDPSALETNAEFDEAAGTYRIDGTKEWVTNGKDADVFVVVASSPASHGRKYREVCAFVVDRSSGGISWAAQSPYALGGCGIGRVRFDRTPVPEENMIGKIDDGLEVAKTCIVHDRFFITTALLNAMKKSFNEAHGVVKTRRQAVVPLAQTELVQQKMAKIGMDIYILESTLYWYAGMADQYDVDLSLESAALQAICYESAIDAVRNCNEILGGKSFELGRAELLDEIRGAVLASKTHTLLRLFVAMHGVQHAAWELAKEVKMARNPLDFPGFVLGRIVDSVRQSRDRPKLDLKLYEELHPSLNSSAELLEHTVLRMKYAVQTILTRYGSETPLKQVDMIRISDLMIDVLAMTAVLARSSRSFCSGIRFCDQEVAMAVAICNERRPRILRTIEELLEGGVVSRDLPVIKLGAEFISQGGYFVEHPLLRNIK